MKGKLNKKEPPMILLDKLETSDSETGHMNAIIESPKGSRNKFEYDPKRGLFQLRKVLPAGAVFPFDMGFVPSTQGEDGDPLDVLVLMDEPVFPGCLVEARLIGVIEAEQTERDGKMMRNDRLIAVAAVAQSHSSIETLEHLEETTVKEIEHFFVSYNEVTGKKFKPIGHKGLEEANHLVEAGQKRFAKQGSG